MPRRIKTTGEASVLQTVSGNTTVQSAEEVGKRRSRAIPKVSKEAYSTVNRPVAALELTPEKRPNAISHDGGKFIDELHGHIDRIASALENRTDKEKKHPDYVRIYSTVGGNDGLLGLARQHLDKAYAAHAMGGETPEERLRAGHSAVEHYRRAATLVSDSLNFMKSEAGFGPRLKYDVKVERDNSGRPKATAVPAPSKEGGVAFARKGPSNMGVNIFGNLDPEARVGTNHHLNGLVDSYQHHVRSSLEKTGVQIPKGVADAPTNSFEDNSPPSQLARDTVGKRGYPLTYTEELERKAVRKAARKSRNETRLRNLSTRSGNTYVLDADNKPIRKPRTSEAFSGVGIGGHHELLTAVAEHYNQNYGHTGVPFIGSAAHKDPIEYAKRHTISLPSESVTVGRALKRMGKTTQGITAGSLANEERDSQPTNVPKLSDGEKARMGKTNVPNTDAKGDVFGKRGRSAEFSTQIEGAKS